MRTVNDLLASAREILQDTDSAEYRYTNVQLVDGLNSAITELKRLRPDVFIYGEALPLVSASNTSVPLPVPEIFFTPFVYFIVGRAELRDDEFTTDGRAITLLTAFNQQVTGKTLQ